MVLNSTLLKESGKAMALEQYYEVNSEGYIIETYMIDTEKEIPPNYFPGWTIPLEVPRWDFELGTWVEGKPYDDILQDAKRRKDSELNSMCQQTIMAGFDHTIEGVVYHFSLDIEAQLNFHGTERLFEKGEIQSIGWTVQRDGNYERIAIDKPLMDELSGIILLHKDANISKYRDVLMKLVEAATTVEEVEAIHWDMVPPTPSVEQPKDEPEEEEPAPTEPTPSDTDGTPGDSTESAG
jgi:hypothetical protein